MRHLLIPYTHIQALRIGNVIEPHEYERDFPKYIKSPEVRKRNAWAYIDARDLGQICDLCVSKDGLGFQVFNRYVPDETVPGAVRPEYTHYTGDGRVGGATE